MDGPQRKYRVVFWGTYDLSKPRVRLLLAGAKKVGMEIIECHTDVWGGLEDKSQLISLWSWLRVLFSLISAYPSLICRYLRLPSHDVVIVGYLGHLDVLVISPFARLRGVPVIWDAFLSLYDTVVNDRHMVSAHSPVAMILYAVEWLACRAPAKVFLDTRAHARYFEQLFRLPGHSIGRVFVGAETNVFSAPARLPHERPCTDAGESPFTVLFYGQFIPLHGIETIIEAAGRVERSGETVRWLVVGLGQEAERIDALIAHLGLRSVERLPWVPYMRLVDLTREADVCLGIFGTSGKAARVIPNKVYQALAASRPLITEDTPAIRELLKAGPLVHLVPPGDPNSLASAVLHLKARRHTSAGSSSVETSLPVIGPAEVGTQLEEILTNSVTSTGPRQQERRGPEAKAEKITDLQHTSERCVEEFYKSSREDYFACPSHIATYKFCLPYVRGKRVLDFGCGSGYGAALIAGSCESVTGVDVSGAAIAYATRSYSAPNLTFKQIEKVEHERLPFSDGEFDVVLSLQVIEHVQDTRAYLSEARRVLGNNGTFIAATPDRCTRLLPHQKPWNRFHVREYSCNSLHDLLAPYFSHTEIFRMSATEEVLRRELRRTGRLMWLTLPFTFPRIPERLRVAGLSLLKSLQQTMKERRAHGEMSVAYDFDENDILIGKSVVPSFGIIAVMRK